MFPPNFIFYYGLHKMLVATLSRYWYGIQDNTRIQNTEIRTRYLDMRLQGSLDPTRDKRYGAKLSTTDYVYEKGLFTWWCWGSAAKCKIYFESLRKSLNNCRVGWRQGRVKPWAFRYKAGPKHSATFGQVCRICVRHDKEKVLNMEQNIQ